MLIENIRIAPITLAFLFLISGFYSGAHSQSQSDPFVDSLKSELQTAAHDSQKVNIYQELTTYTMRRNPVAALKYVSQLDSLAELNNWGRVKVFATLNRGASFHYRGLIDEAEKYYKRSNALADSLGLNSKRISGLQNLGVIEMDRGNYEEAHNFLDEAGKIARSKNDSSSISDIMINKGMTYYNQENFPRALALFHDALEIKLNSDDIVGVAGLYNNIGMVHRSRQDDKKAADYYAKALEIWQERGDLQGIGMTTNNLGVAKAELGKNREAISYFSKSLEIAKRMNYGRGVADNTRNIGRAYFRLGKLDSAMVYQKRALKMARQSGQPQIVAPILVDMAQIHVEWKNYDQAMADAREALKLNEQVQLMSIRQTANRAMYEIYNARGNSDEALTHYKKYIAARDSIQSEKNYRKVVQLEYQYNLNRERQKLQAEKEKQSIAYEARIAREELVNNIYLVALIAGLIVIGFIFRSYRIKQKANEEIRKKKEQIEKQADELKEAYEKLQQLDDFKEGMANMLVHDLKNPLSQIIHASRKNGGSAPQLDRIQQAGHQMLNLVMNILDVYKYENASMELNHQPHAISKLAENAVERVNQQAEAKNLQIEMLIPESATVNVDKDIVERVFENLLTNAIKYSPTGETITVAAERQEDGLKVSVRDRGEGIPKEQQEKVFNRFEQMVARELGETRSTGLGLSFCKLAVEAHGSSIGINSEPGEGTTFFFYLPLADGEQSEGNLALHSDDRSKIQSKKYQTNVLPSAQLQKLQPVLDRLQELEIYDISAIREVLKSEILDEDELLAAWKNEVYKAVAFGDSNRYEELINQTSARV